jgi:CspA family cold shock protein
MPQGTVQWFNDSKGLGSIRAKDGDDVQVHYSAIRGDGLRRLVRGDEVRFEIRETESGLEAANVVRN